MPLSNRIGSLINFAADLAVESTEDCRHGCVIANKWKILSFGFNKAKTHPVAVETYTQCIHAEMAAIKSARQRDLVGADLFVVRIKRSIGQPRGMSRPCTHCMKLIQDSKIKRVFYTNKDGRVEMIRF